MRVNQTSIDISMVNLSYQKAEWPAGANVNDYIDFSYSKYKE